MTEDREAIPWTQYARDWLIPVSVTVFVLVVTLTYPPSTYQQRPFSEAVKIWLALGGALLAANWVFLARGWGQRMLIALTLMAGLNYYRFDVNVATSKVDSYDLIHYYLGAKYFDQLGYYDLYPAALLVDWENKPYNRKSTFYRAQDAEHGYRERVPLSQGIQRGLEVRERFESLEAWKEFEHDFLFLQREKRVGRKLWNDLINDRGFNGTPAWLFVARPIAKLFPVETIKLLGYLDVVLLLLGLLALGWAYGWLTPLWATFFLFVTYSLRWPHVTWVFLRYDWVAALMIGMAFMKKSRWAPAGVMVGYAAVIRFFPVVWMFGPFMKGLFGLFRGGLKTDGPKGRPWKDRLDKRMLLVAAGFLATVAFLEGGAIASFGTEAVGIHAGNIAEHIKPEELSSRRVGLALATTYDGRGDRRWLRPERKLTIKEQAPIRTAGAVVLLVLLGFGLRKRRPDEAFALGFLPFFLLATASYYYYVCRITLVAWHASDLSQVRHRVGLVWLLGLEVMCNWAETTAPGFRMLLIGHLAWGLMAYAILMTAWLLEESGPSLDVEEVPDDRPLVDGEPDWRGQDSGESERRSAEDG